MPFNVMMGPSEFKMLSEEPRDRVVLGTMDDYERALALGLITPYQGRPLRFDQPAPAQSAQTAAAPAQPQAEWRGRPVPTPPAQTYSAPAPVAYQPAPSRGSVGMQIVSAGQPVVREPARMQGAADYAALNAQPMQPVQFDTTQRTPAEVQMQAWNGPAVDTATGNPATYLYATRYKPLDRSNWGRPYTPPVPASPQYLAMPQSVPEPLVQQWNAQNIPGLSDMTGPMRPVTPPVMVDEFGNVIVDPYSNRWR